MFSRGGTLLPSIHADVRYIDDVIAIEGVYYQKCHDPDCRRANYMSNDFPIPQHLLPSADVGCNVFTDDDELDQQLSSDAALAEIDALEAGYIAGEDGSSIGGGGGPRLSDADLSRIDQLEADAFGDSDNDSHAARPELHAQRSTLPAGGTMAAGAAGAATNNHEHDPTDAQIEAMLAENPHLFE